MVALAPVGSDETDLPIGMALFHQSQRHRSNHALNARSRIVAAQHSQIDIEPPRPFDWRGNGSGSFLALPFYAKATNRRARDSLVNSLRQEIEKRHRK